MPSSTAKMKGKPATPAASSGVEIGCASKASSVPVSCSSRSRRDSPSTDAWSTTVSAIPTAANAKYVGAPSRFVPPPGLTVFEM